MLIFSACFSAFQSLYPLSLLNGSLEEGKASLATSSAAIGRNLAAHQGYAVVTGDDWLDKKPTLKLTQLLLNTIPVIIILCMNKPVTVLSGWLYPLMLIHAL